MPEVEFTLPATGSEHPRPEFVLYDASAFWLDEIEHMKPQGIVEGGKPQQLKTCRIDILDLAAERGDADEVGRSLHDRRKSPFLSVSLPLLEGDRRLIGAGTQEEPFGPRGKRVAEGTGGQRRVAAESDRRRQDVQIAAIGCVGNNKLRRSLVWHQVNLIPRKRLRILPLQTLLKLQHKLIEVGWFLFDGFGDRLTGKLSKPSFIGIRPCFTVYGVPFLFGVVVEGIGIFLPAFFDGL